MPQGGIKKHLGAIPSQPILLVFCLGVWGCVAVFNSTFYKTNPYFFSMKQGAWLIISALALIGAAAIPARIYEKYYWLATTFVLVPLWVVWIWGTPVNGMTGWFDIGGLLSSSPDHIKIFIQPSELGKPFFALTLALWMSRRFQSAKKLVTEAGYIAIAILWLLPIILEPDFGTAAVYIIAAGVIFWGLGGRSITLACLSATAFAGLLAAMHSMPYVMGRIQGYLYPDKYSDTSGYHILQYEKTLANGGLWGQSLGNSRWSELYLPHAHHDSAFASFGEAVGFAGLLPVFIIIVGLLYYCLHKAWEKKTMTRAAIIYSLVTLVTIQALIHISVALGILPPTGITMPFLSYGGSSLLSTMLICGIICSMLRTDEKEPEEQES